MPKCRREVPFSMPQGTLPGLRLLRQEGRSEPAVGPVPYLPAPRRCLGSPAVPKTELDTYVLGTRAAPQIAAFLHLVSLFFLAGCGRRQIQTLGREGVKVTHNLSLCLFFHSPALQNVHVRFTIAVTVLPLLPKYYSAVSHSFLPTLI